MSLDVIDGSGSSLGRFSIAGRQTITIANTRPPRATKFAFTPMEEASSPLATRGF